jgi:hypothetical protein
MRTVEQGKRTELMERVLELRALLYDHVRSGKMDAELDSVFWSLDWAVRSDSEVTHRQVIYDAEVLLDRLQPERRKRFEVQARVISKEEHDAMLEGPAQRSVSKEDYERMMREAQE